MENTLKTDETQIICEKCGENTEKWVVKRGKTGFGICRNCIKTEKKEVLDDGCENFSVGDVGNTFVDPLKPATDRAVRVESGLKNGESVGLVGMGDSGFMGSDDVEEQSLEPPALGYLTKLRTPEDHPRFSEGSFCRLMDNKLELQPFKTVRGQGDNWKQKLLREKVRVENDIKDLIWVYGNDHYEQILELSSKLSEIKDLLKTKGSKKMVGWSHKSRVALIRRLMEVTVSGFSTPFFVSMTYHLDFPNAKGAKNDLKNYFDRLKTIDPDVGYVWKMEFQDRGAPHFHCIIFPSKNSRLSGNQIRKKWHAIAKDDDDDNYHEEHGTDVQRVERLGSFKKMYRYVSKYATKQVEATEANGRYWGTSRNVVDPTKTDVLEVTEETDAVVRRIAKRILRGVSPYHGNQRLHGYTTLESRKVSGEYYEIPKQRGYHRQITRKNPDTEKPETLIKWHDRSRYSKQIAERWRGWTVHLGLSKENAFKLLEWAIEGNNERYKPERDLPKGKIARSYFSMQDVHTVRPEGDLYEWQKSKVRG